MKKVSVSFTLNGDPVTAEVPVTWTLLKTLREYFDLTGAKEGCGHGRDQDLVGHLGIFRWFNGSKIVTIELGHVRDLFLATPFPKLEE